MTPYGNVDLGQQWLGKWLGAGRQQAITWTNVDFSSMWLCGTYPTLILWDVLKISIHKTNLKIILLKVLPHLPGANELKVIAPTVVSMA